MSATKSPKEYNPIFTDKLNGHHPNDLIVIYMKYEDRIEDNANKVNESYNKKHSGKYIPQWFSINRVDDKSSISLPASSLICTFKEIENYGRKSMSRLVRGGVRNVLFYYSSDVINMYGMSPF